MLENSAGTTAGVTTFHYRLNTSHTLALQINPGNSKINCSTIYKTIESYIHTHNI